MKEYSNLATKMQEYTKMVKELRQTIENKDKEIKAMKQKQKSSSTAPAEQIAPSGSAKSKVVPIPSNKEKNNWQKRYEDCEAQRLSLAETLKTELVAAE